MECTVKSKESFVLISFATVAEKCFDQNSIQSRTLNTQFIIPIQAEVYFDIEDWFGLRNNLLLNEVA